MTRAHQRCGPLRSGLEKARATREERRMVQIHLISARTTCGEATRRNYCPVSVLARFPFAFFVDSIGLRYM